MKPGKTHKASAKRFKVTATGRIFHCKMGYEHKRTKKRPQYKRAARKLVEVRGADKKMMRRLLQI
ncbi:MAG: 50S ribosomal protein L35 [Candidatus Bipolaricaulaceae bacterium]